MPDARPHPTAQQLANYGLGKLPAAELSSIHAHVAACAECRQKVEDQPPDSFMGQLCAAAGGASVLPTVPPSPSNTSIPVRRSADALCPRDGPAARAHRQKLDRLCQRGGQGEAEVAAVQDLCRCADIPAGGLIGNVPGALCVKPGSWRGPDE